MRAARIARGTPGHTIPAGTGPKLEGVWAGATGLSGRQRKTPRAAAA